MAYTVTKNHTVAPVEIHHDIDAPGLHKTELVDRQSGPEDDFVLSEFAFFGTDANE